MAFDVLHTQLNQCSVLKEAVVATSSDVSQRSTRALSLSFDSSQDCLVISYARLILHCHEKGLYSPCNPGGHPETRNRSTIVL